MHRPEDKHRTTVGRGAPEEHRWGRRRLLQAAPSSGPTGGTGRCHRRTRSRRRPPTGPTSGEAPSALRRLCSPSALPVGRGEGRKGWHTAKPRSRRGDRRGPTPRPRGPGGDRRWAGRRHTTSAAPGRGEPSRASRAADWRGHSSSRAWPARCRDRPAQPACAQRSAAMPGLETAREWHNPSERPHLRGRRSGRWERSVTTPAATDREPMTGDADGRSGHQAFSTRQKCHWLGEGAAGSATSRWV